MGHVLAQIALDEVLTGAVPMDDMDLVLSPARRTVAADPAGPNLPQARVKGSF